MMAWLDTGMWLLMASFALIAFIAATEDEFGTRFKIEFSIFAVAFTAALVTLTIGGIEMYQAWPQCCIPYT